MDESKNIQTLDAAFYDDPGPAIQAAAERHLELVWEAFYYDEENDGTGTGEEPTSPAVGPFCGCETCQVREILAGAWPLIEAYFTRGRPVADLRGDE